MKLPKTLLAAIVVGITTQAVVSCTKDNTEPPKDPIKKEVPKPWEGNCPACGMG